MIIENPQLIRKTLAQFHFNQATNTEIDPESIIEDLQLGVAAALVKTGEDQYSVVYRTAANIVLSEDRPEAVIEPETELEPEAVIEPEAQAQSEINTPVYQITGPIRSDDPDAIAKLKQQLDEGQRLQERMKAATKLAKANDRLGLAELGYSPQEIHKLLNPTYGRVGHQSWELSNNNQNLRRIKLRITELENQQDWESQTYQSDIPGVEVEESVEDNRIRIKFPDKPSAEIRKLLKTNGFKWSRLNSAWQRLLNQQGKYVTQTVLKHIQELEQVAA